ncbi:MAG: YCF48-related protein [bacterium]
MAGLEPGSGEAIKYIQFVDQKTGYLAGGSGIMFKTTDGGNSWKQLRTKTQARINGISFIDANTGLVAFGPAAGEYGAPSNPPVLRKTTDGGNTFTDVSSGALVSRITMVDANNGYAFTAGDNWNILSKTSDGGASWRNMKEAAGVNSDLNDLAVIDANTCVVVSKSGEVFKTTDGGNSWTTVKVTIPTPTADVETELYAVKFINAKNGWVAGKDNAVFKTTDGGATWADISPKEKFGLTTFFAIDAKSANEVMVTGNTAGVIMHTTNGGAKWVAEKTQPGSGSFYAIVSLGAKAFVVGNGGNGVFQKKGK